MGQLNFTSVSAVPSYAGLQRFSEGRNFEQWTGDDSKALMKVVLTFHVGYITNPHYKQVYIAAIAGHVPSEMVWCMSVFMELCYIFRRNVITTAVLMTAEDFLKQFHTLRNIFITKGVRSSISLPHQHALVHYLTSIPLFGSPNGLCSSITESKHIKAVKEPWRRSSRFKALVQMLRTIIRLEKLATLRRRFLQENKLIGSTAAHFSQGLGGASESDDSDETISNSKYLTVDINEDAECLGDVGPESGPQSLSSIALAATPGMFSMLTFTIY